MDSAHLSDPSVRTAGVHRIKYDQCGLGTQTPEAFHQQQNLRCGLQRLPQSRTAGQELQRKLSQQTRSLALEHPEATTISSEPVDLPFASVSLSSYTNCTNTTTQLWSSGAGRGPLWQTGLGLGHSGRGGAQKPEESPHSLLLGHFNKNS